MSGGSRPQPIPPTLLTSEAPATDPLSRTVAAGLQSHVGTGPSPGVFHAFNDASRARGLAAPSIDLINRTVGGQFTDPQDLATQVEAASAPAIRQFQRAALPSITGRFAAAGRSGSGAEHSAIENVQDIVSRNITETAAGLIGSERGRQQQAAGFFPQLETLDRARAASFLDLEREPLDRILQIAGALPSTRVGLRAHNPQFTPGSGSKGAATNAILGNVAGSFFGPVGTAAGSALGNKLFGGF